MRTDAPSRPLALRRWLIAAALIGAVAIALLPTGETVVVGGHAHPLVLPLQTSDETGTYLLATASVRQRFVGLAIARRLGAVFSWEQAASPHDTSMIEAKRQAWRTARDIVGRGLAVDEVAAASPAARGGLRPGDVIFDINGHRPSAALIDRSLALGDTLRLRVLHDGIVREVTMTPGPAPARRASGGGAVFSVAPSDLAPPQIDTGSVRGDSAGLVLALAYVDMLTPGDLTNGRVVSATGAIDAGGKVGSVLGYAAKAAAVRRHDARLFIVPVHDAGSIRATAPPQLEVIGVKSVVHAVFEMCAWGGRTSVCENAVPGAR